MAAATSSYPPPPPYYRLYKDYLDDLESAPEPPPPVQGTYPLFGATYTTDVVLPSLEDQGVRQLYPKGPNIGLLPQGLQLCVASPLLPFLKYSSDIDVPKMRREEAQRLLKEALQTLDGHVA